MTLIQRFILTEVILTWFSQKTGWTHFSWFILDSKKIILQMSHGCLRCLNFTCHHCLPEYLQRRRTVFFFWLSVLLMVRIRGGFCNVRTLGMMVTKGRHSLNFGEDEFLLHQSQMPQLSEVLILFLARIDCTSFRAARFIFNYIPWNCCRRKV